MIPSGGMNSAAIAMKDATRKAPMANRGFVHPVSIGPCLCHLYRSFGQKHDKENPAGQAPA